MKVLTIFQLKRRFSFFILLIIYSFLSNNKERKANLISEFLFCLVVSHKD
nr:hypothetical protein pmam_68 [Pithovirus mammoth]